VRRAGCRRQHKCLVPAGCCPVAVPAFVRVCYVSNLIICYAQMHLTYCRCLVPALHSLADWFSNWLLHLYWITYCISNWFVHTTRMAIRKEIVSYYFHNGFVHTACLVHLCKVCNVGSTRQM
jgi:hypothetical protein